MLVTVDAASDRPIYAQIADSARAAIAAGSLGPGETLPAAKQVAAGLKVNQHTVLHAYQMLRDEGLVDLRRGRGAVVTEAAARIAELYDAAAALAARAEEVGVAPAALAAIVMHAGREGSRIDGGSRAAGSSPGLASGPGSGSSPDPGAEAHQRAVAHSDTTQEVER